MKILITIIAVAFLSGCAALPIIPAFLLPITEGAKMVGTILTGSPGDDVGDHQEGPM